MASHLGKLTIYGRSCDAAHAAVVLIPPSEGETSFSLYLHADALATGGGFLMLDHLPVGNISKIDDLDGACISFRDDEPDADDTAGSDPCDLETSGWTFSGYEDDDSKNWRFDTFHASVEGLGGNRFRVRIKCRLSNWLNDERLDGQAEFECQGEVGSPPVFDAATNTWTELEP